MGASGATMSLRRAFPYSALAVLLLVLTVIWVKPSAAPLYGVDAACYGRVARDIAERPWAAWGEITWSGTPFYEHPPGFMWLESLVFRAFGSTPAAAVALGRACASAVVLLTFATAYLLAGINVATYSALGFLWLAGFQYDSQNPMLEMPLTAALTLSALGVALLQRRGRRGAGIFVAGFVIAAWVKGPPALAAFPLLVFGAWRVLSWRHMAGLVAAALGTWLMTAAVFEAWRAHSGLPCFFCNYWQHQVLRSVVQGNNNPVDSPMYHLKALVHWYPLGLLGLLGALLCGVRRRPHDAARRRMGFWGLAWVGILVVGFSIPKQKYHWYMHTTAPGFAWLWGVLLATLAAKAPRWQKAAPWVFAAGTPIYLLLLLLIPQRMFTPRPELSAMQNAPAPVFLPGERRAVAHCGKTGGWHASHMFDFLWRAEAAHCGELVPYRFDGNSLSRTPDRQPNPG